MLICMLASRINSSLARHCLTASAKSRCRRDGPNSYWANPAQIRRRIGNAWQGLMQPITNGRQLQVVVQEALATQMSCKCSIGPMPHFRIQNPVRATSCGFKSHLRYSRFSLIKQGLRILFREPSFFGLSTVATKTRPAVQLHGI